MFEMGQERRRFYKNHNQWSMSADIECNSEKLNFLGIYYYIKQKNIFFIDGFLFRNRPLIGHRIKTFWS